MKTTNHIWSNKETYDTHFTYGDSFLFLVSNLINVQGNQLSLDSIACELRKYVTSLEVSAKPGSIKDRLLVEGYMNYKSIEGNIDVGTMKLPLIEVVFMEYLDKVNWKELAEYYF